MRVGHTGRIETRPAVSQQRPGALEIGRPLGKVRLDHGTLMVYSVGPVQLGPTRYVAGVAPPSRQVFLTRLGKLHLLLDARLEAEPPPKPERVWVSRRPWVRGGRRPDPKTRVERNRARQLHRARDQERLRLWADVCARMVVEAIVPSPNRALLEAEALDYQERVELLVDRACRAAAEHGLERRPVDYARAVHPSWTARDLLAARVPSIQHALLVSLVLALEPFEAVPLICHAALQEFQAPLVDEVVARALYQQAVRLLATLCPAWWGQGALTDWTQVGCIDLLWRDQHARTLALAQERQVGLAVVAGLAPVRASRRHRRRRQTPGKTDTSEE